MEEFLKPEVRCEFFVDAKRKKLWKIELDMLNIFDSICEKYSLHYFLIAGGMLGAVRHKGFIPWDDDIDIGMPREDYDVFLKIAQQELPNPLFLQDGMNEVGYFDTIVRIRDPRTTGIIRKDIDSPCNNGIFIEIFPYDNVPDDRNKAKIQDLMIRIYKNILLRSVYSIDSEKRIKRKVFEIISDMAIRLFGKEHIFNKYKAWCTKYNSIECSYRNILTAYSYRNTFKYKKNQINELIRVPFEYTNAYIPKEYDKCLSQVYHDYMSFPPVEKRGLKHEEIVIYDPDIDYKAYLQGIREGKFENPFLNADNGAVSLRRIKEWRK